MRAREVLICDDDEPDEIPDDDADDVKCKSISCVPSTRRIEIISSPTLQFHVNDVPTTLLFDCGELMVISTWSLLYN